MEYQLKLEEIQNQSTNTELINKDYNWVYLRTKDGYNVYLKTFFIDSKYRTISINDWTMPCFAIHNYELNKLIVDDEWTNVFKDIYASTEKYSKDWFVPYISQKEIEEMVEMTEDYIWSWENIKN